MVAYVQQAVKPLGHCAASVPGMVLHDRESLFSCRVSAVELCLICPGELQVFHAAVAFFCVAFRTSGAQQQLALGFCVPDDMSEYGLCGSCALCATAACTICCVKQGCWKLLACVCCVLTATAEAGSWIVLFTACPQCTTYLGLCWNNVVVVMKPICRLETMSVTDFHLLEIL